MKKTLVLLVFGMAGMASAAQVQQLEADEPVWDLAVAAFSAEGRPAILALTGDGEADVPGKQLVLFQQDAAGAFQEQPSYTMSLPVETGSVFLAEFDGTPPREVVAASARWMRVYGWTGEAFEERAIIERETLFPLRSREPSILRQVAFDLDGDGRDEWLLPVPGGFDVVRGEKTLGKIEIPVLSERWEGGELNLLYRHPEVQPIALEDGAPKALAMRTERALFVAHGEHWQELWRYRLPQREDDSWKTEAQMADMNNDGFPDIVLSYLRGSVNMESTTAVYLSQGAFELPEEPTFELRQEGALSAPLLRDMNADGEREMLMVTMPFGMKNLMNYFFRKRVQVGLKVYALDGGKLQSEPVAEADFGLAAPEGKDELAYILADFTGDGVLDLGLAEAPGELAIYAGEGQGALSSRPVLTLDMPSYGEARAYELGGDEGKELIILHRDTPRARQIELATGLSGSS